MPPALITVVIVIQAPQTSGAAFFDFSPTIYKNMNRQTFLEKYLQLNLGQFIQILEQYGTHDDDGDRLTIQFDFGSAVPTTFKSWRGDYSELQLGYSLRGYDSETEHHKNVFADDFLTICRDTVNKIFTSWKGGEYRMTLETPIWVSNSGNGSHTAIIGFKDGVILTAYCEY